MSPESASTGLPRLPWSGFERVWVLRQGVRVNKVVSEERRTGLIACDGVLPLGGLRGWHHGLTRIWDGRTNGRSALAKMTSEQAYLSRCELGYAALSDKSYCLQVHAHQKRKMDAFIIVQLIAMPCSAECGVRWGAGHIRSDSDFDRPFANLGIP